jgi:NTP pyrophosphatase (non-canonical NTP hydrolase)
MAITTGTVGQIQLDDLVEAVHGIYSIKDAKRTLWDVWMHANHHASGIAEEVRKGNRGEELMSQVADCAMWLFTMVTRLQGQIGVPKARDSEQESLIRIASSCSVMLWKRFPGMCPFCYWRRIAGARDREKEPGFTNPCDCALQTPEKLNADQKRHHAALMTAFSQENIARRPNGVDEWQKMFATIFAANLSQLSIGDISLHLLEEMGEVSNALARMYSYSEKSFVANEPLWRQFQLEEELSDVLSRLFAIAHALSFESTRAQNGAKTLLSQIIWRRYGSDKDQRFTCWKCKEPSCSCPIIMVPLDRSVDELRGLIQSTGEALVE